MVLEQLDILMQNQNKTKKVKSTYRFLYLSQKLTQDGL